MGRTACKEPQYLYKGALYFTFYLEDVGVVGSVILKRLLNMADDCGLGLSAT